mmetsp:Transcript_59338/g.156208  ORF Transcript_59338/g.156208 Transcript_59338/m.156208 type:complete len:272 (+) Transcript_59338:70-885(+)
MCVQTILSKSQAMKVRYMYTPHMHVCMHRHMPTEHQNTRSRANAAGATTHDSGSLRPPKSKVSSSRIPRAHSHTRKVWGRAKSCVVLTVQSPAELARVNDTAAHNSDRSKRANARRRGLRPYRAGCKRSGSASTGFARLASQSWAMVELPAAHKPPIKPPIEKSTARPPVALCCHDAMPPPPPPASGPSPACCLAGDTGCALATPRAPAPVPLAASRKSGSALGTCGTAEPPPHAFAVRADPREACAAGAPVTPLSPAATAPATDADPRRP